MSHNHFVKVCSCGTIIINCGCTAKDKTEIVIKNGCTTCLKATESAAPSGQAEFELLYILLRLTKGAKAKETTP
jgi:hypothetical protein